MAKAARKFFYGAAFDPSLPKVSDREYERLIQLVLRRGSQSVSDSPVIFPGYPDLFTFSGERSGLIKKQAGGAWRSYVQRGNWRMVFPFSEKHQRKTAQTFKSKLDENLLPIAHLTRFPALTINHAVLIFRAEQEPGGTKFLFYDPNNPQQPGILHFNETDGRFSMPPNSYFAGGRVDVYEVFRSLLY